MTEEIKSKIDKISHSSMFEPTCEWIAKSDVISLVENLTKWNKVEDAPKMYDEGIIVKTKTGYELCSYYGPSGFMAHKRSYMTKRGNASDYASIPDVIEWKYIN